MHRAVEKMGRLHQKHLSSMSHHHAGPEAPDSDVPAGVDAVGDDGLAGPRIARLATHHQFRGNGTPGAVDEHLVEVALDTPLDVWADHRIVTVTALGAVRGVLLVEPGILLVGEVLAVGQRLPAPQQAQHHQ